MFQKVILKRGPFLTYFAIGFCFDNPILDPLAVRFMYSQLLTGLDWLNEYHPSFPSLPRGRHWWYWCIGRASIGQKSKIVIFRIFFK